MFSPTPCASCVHQLTLSLQMARCEEAAAPSVVPSFERALLPPVCPTPSPSHTHQHRLRCLLVGLLNWELPLLLVCRQRSCCCRTPPRASSMRSTLQPVPPQTLRPAAAALQTKQGILLLGQAA